MTEATGSTPQEVGPLLETGDDVMAEQKLEEKSFAAVRQKGTSVGTPQLVIREAREDELTTMLRVTKASYAEFRGGSPDGFWDMYMANIEEAVLRTPDTERVAAF